MELPLMSRSSKLRLILADDHPVLREDLSLILGLLPEMAVAGQASTGEEAFELFLKLEPDVLILDLQMPGEGGVRNVERLLKQGTQTKKLQMH
jgi:DNA-binding NarL/FixJ family response regulator